MKIFLFTLSTVLAQISPGGRLAHAMEQADATTLYIFGGYGRGNNESVGYLNDVWKFDITTGIFSHLKGPRTINGLASFGTTPNAANQPGARQNAASTYLNFKMYVFGGNGFVTSGSLSYLADLWSFELSSLMWTYISGSQEPNVIGIHGAANSYSVEFRPGGRFGCGMSFNKNGNELIIFGGRGIGATTGIGNLGDVWGFRLIDNVWAYKAGHVNVDQLGTSAGLMANYKPGGRYSMVFECAAATEFCFIFGGFGSNNGATGYLNDIWSFSQTSGIFSPLARGKYDAVNVGGIYGTQGTNSPDNYPGCRSNAASYFDTSKNRIIVYGGYGYVLTGTAGYLNDVWSFDVTSVDWAWLSGSNVLNQVALANRGGSRQNHAIASASPTSFYVFGGFGYGYSASGHLSDLWHHTIADNWNLVGGSLDLNMKGQFYFNESATATRKKALTDVNAASASNSNNLVLIFSVVSIAAIGFILLIISRVRSRILKQRKEKSASSNSAPSILSTRTRSSITSNITLAPTTIGLSLPAHLLVTELDFRYGDLIASGGGGDVYSGDAIGFELIRRCRQIVVKRPKITKDQTLKLFEQEISVMYLLSHSRYVAKIVGFSLQPPVLLMKKYADGSLLSCGTKHALSRKWKLRFSLEISRGLFDIHSAQIAHCDIKPDNVLIDRSSSGRPFGVITDFGIAQVLSETLIVVKYAQVINIRGLSIKYASPESFVRFRNNIDSAAPKLMKANDVYALAMAMFFLLCRKEPWN